MRIDNSIPVNDGTQLSIYTRRIFGERGIPFVKLLLFKLGRLEDYSYAAFWFGVMLYDFKYDVVFEEYLLL